MRNSSLLFFIASFSLGSIAACIVGAIHENRKSRKHQPAAILRDLYEDNAASAAAIF